MAKKKKETTLRGIITKVFYNENGFFSGILKQPNGDTVRVCGAMTAKENDAVVLCGCHEVNKYGEQFKVTSFEYDVDFDIDGIVHYLTRNPNMKGIGQKRARLIAEFCGSDFDRIVTETPTKLLTIKGVTPDIVEKLSDEWVKYKSLNKTITFLARFGITHKQINALIDKYGNFALPTLRENPYKIIEDIPGYGFKKADTIALKMGVQKDDPMRVQAALVFLANKAVQDGDTWIESDELISQANKLLIMDTLDSREIIEKQLDVMIHDGSFIAYSFDNRQLVSLPSMFNMEKFIGDSFSSFTENNNQFDSDEIKKHIPPELNDCQRRAFMAAAKNKAVLIAGGAGSGKSYVVARIAEMYVSHGYRVALAAPTGKAAKRIEQLVDMPAQTIHRLLRYNRNEFERNEDNPLHYDVVIIDEVSMLDVPLCYHLFKAIDFTKTNLVLVGDHNQLPPVGPGNIIRDILTNNLIPTVVLDEIVRQAGLLKKNCLDILDGRVAGNSKKKEGTKSWYVMNHFTEQMDILSFITHLYANILDEKLGYNIVTDVQLLSPIRKGLLGVNNLNIVLQRLVQKKYYGAVVDEVPAGRKPKYHVNDKVIQLRNNYDLGVMNGSVGTIEAYDAENDVYHILFDNEEIAVEREDMKNISLAYCISIHRSQGSEWPCVVGIVHKSHSFMHHRNLLYTEVTRAKNTAIIIGDKWGIRNCASKKLVDRRRTFLSIDVFQTEKTSKTKE